MAEGQVETLASTVPGNRLAAAETVRAALDGDPVITRHDRGGTPYAVHTRVIEDFAGEPIAVAEIAMDRTFYAANAAGTRTFVAVLAAVMLAVGAALAWILTRSITAPLNATVDSLNNIAEGEGDLTRRLPESGRDEITALAKGYNRFADRLRDLVSQVAESASMVAIAAEKLSEVSEQTRRGASSQQEEIHQLATAMNQMSTSVQDIAQNTQSVADASREASERTQEGLRSPYRGLLPSPRRGGGEDANPLSTAQRA